MNQLYQNVIKDWLCLGAGEREQQGKGWDNCNWTTIIKNNKKMNKLRDYISITLLEGNIK